EPKLANSELLSFRPRRESFLDSSHPLGITGIAVIFALCAPLRDIIRVSVAALPRQALCGQTLRPNQVIRYIELQVPFKTNYSSCQSFPLSL
ncbi:MAG: hypothetical protein ACXWWP_12600, partial [Candidatus Binatia bacterium]